MMTLMRVLSLPSLGFHCCLGVERLESEED